MRLALRISILLLAVISLFLAGCAAQKGPKPVALPVATEEEDALKFALAGKDSLQAGRYEGAIVLFRQSLGKVPAYVDAQKGLAIALKEAGKNDEAIVAHQEVLRSFPDDAQFRAGLAYLYLVSDSLDRSAEEYLKVVKKTPDDDKVYKNLGYIYSKKGQFADAVMAYERSLEIRPGDVETLKNLATLYMENDLLAEAAGIFEKIFDADSSDVSAARNLTSVSMKLENYPRAITVCKRALVLDPKSDGDRFILANAYQRSKQTDKAAVEFETIIAGNPDYRGAYCSLAQIYNEKNLPAKTVALASKGIEKDPNSACLICALGKALELQGKFEEAMQMFSKASGDAQWGQYADTMIKREQSLIDRRDFEKKKKEKKR